MNCIFCNLDRAKEKILFESYNFKFLESKFPIVTGHALLISKMHLRSEIEILTKYITEYKEVSDRAYKLIEKKYKKAPATIINAPQDQSVQHFHKHYIPGVFGVLGIEKAIREYLNQ